MQGKSENGTVPKGFYPTPNTWETLPAFYPLVVRLCSLNGLEVTEF
jgi:hypothetical protein